MKEGLHPEYHPVVFVDSAADFELVTRSTKTSGETREIDGEQRFVDTAGRVEKFQRKYQQFYEAQDKAKAKVVKRAAAAKPAPAVEAAPEEAATEEAPEEATTEAAPAEAATEEATEPVAAAEAEPNAGVDAAAEDETVDDGAEAGDDSEAES